MSKRLDHWVGPRTFSVPRRSDQERAQALAEKIDLGKELTADDRREAANFLRRFATREQSSKKRGAPIRSFAREIAIHRMLQMALHGNEAAAVFEVAKFWSKDTGHVKNCFTAWRWEAENLVDEILKYRVGMKGLRMPSLGVTEDVGMTKEQVLKDCDIDLRAWAKKELRKRKS